MKEGYVKITRVLLSVSDKTRVVELAQELHMFGVELISTGGTAEKLRAAGLKVMDVSEYTGFPEMFDGRVKTLNPKVHGGLLFIRGNAGHEATAAKHNIKPIDMVVVNLYPFEETVAKPDCTLADVIKNIDIGGPAMLRSAAKNHASVTVMSNPEDYAAVIDEMKANDGCVGQETRSRLALEAFSVTSAYDSAVAKYLAKNQGVNFPNILTLSFHKSRDFRYGENPHQHGALYLGRDASEPGIARAKLLPGGRELSFNNLGDANGALELIKEFPVCPTVAIIKHANPAGCSSDYDLLEAYHKAYMADVNAAMGGIIAVNRPMTAELADAIVHSYRRWGKDAGAGAFFAEIILAESFDEEVVRIIRSKEGWGSEVRLLEIGPLTGQRNSEKAFKYVVGGTLVQDRDLLGLNTDQWKVVTKRAPTDKEMVDLHFAWLVCKHVKSNAIVLAKDQTLLGAGAGQMSRVNSAMLANLLAKRYGGIDVLPRNHGCVLASDAFFPFPDSLDWAVEAGATAVIEPGGSKKDADVIARADELDLAMVFAGTRHFNH